MARFLSPEWFREIETAAPLRPPAGGDRLTIKQVVRGGPEGDVTYVVVVQGGQARIEEGRDAGPSPDLTITTDWDTAAAIAQGALSAERALMDGRMRFAGNLDRLAARAAGLAGLDPVPTRVRETTTY